MPKNQLSERISKDQIRKAVEALIVHNKQYTREKEAKRKETDQPLPLFNEEEDGNEFYYLQLTLFKIPSNPTSKPVRLPLKHSLYGNKKYHDSNVCFICKDPVEEYEKELLEDEPLDHITKVVSISNLKKNYRQYKDKRELCSTYDLFLADDRILTLLPNLLGKVFFQCKKNPSAVRMKSKKWKDEILKARDSTYMYYGHGTTLMIKIARSNFKAAQIVENVQHALESAVSALSHQWKSVQGVSIKSSRSIALPLYQSVQKEK